MEATRMVRVATTGSAFHARVIAARLGADGMVTQLRGNVDGLYPMGEVHVYVSEDELADATDLLLVDEVESAFDTDDYARSSRRPELWVTVGAVLAIIGVAVSRAV